jgi:hypothetical protein
MTVRVTVEQVAPAVFGVHHADSEGVRDEPAFVGHGGLLDAQQTGELVGAQVQSLVGVGKEVDPTDRVDDPGGLDPAVAAHKRRRALARELGGQHGAQPSVFRVQMPGAERVGDRGDLVEDRPHRRRELRSFGGMAGLVAAGILPGASAFVSAPTLPRPRGLSVEDIPIVRPSLA